MDALYSITFLAWAVCVLHALEHCDLIVDIELAERSGYGQAIADAVHDQSGLEVSFHDMHAPMTPSPLRLAHQHQIEQEVLRWIAAPAATACSTARASAGASENSPPAAPTCSPRCSRIETQSSS